MKDSLSIRRGRPHKTWIRYAALFTPLFGAVVGSAAPNALTPGEGSGGSSTDPAPSLSYSVGRTGAASYGYRFQLPPARGGYAPALNLSYSSAAQPLGTEIAWGWELTPLPRIRRNVHRDGAPGASGYVVDMGGGEQDLIPVI